MSKFIFLISLSLLAAHPSVFAQTFEIQLNEDDQRWLTKDLSKIDLKYRSEELIDKDLPTWHVVKKYNFLDKGSPFFINCSEKFLGGSTHGLHAKCVIGFNYEVTDPELLVHDGFIPEFAIAELKGALARDLYKTIGNGVSPTVSFNSSEQLQFTHPTTGQKFNAFRMRIECKRDAAYKIFSCQVGAVK